MIPRSVTVLFVVLGLGLSTAVAEIVEEKSPDGKVTARFTTNGAGEKQGAYTGFHPNGSVKVKATYKVGKLNGIVTQYEKNQPVFSVTYKDGEPSYGRTREQLRKKLAELAATPDKNDEMATEREEALRRLRAYRYLVEVPCDNLVLDDALNRAA